MSDNPIQIKIDKSVFNEKFFPYLFDYSHRFEVYRGGSGSGKSLTFHSTENHNQINE